MIRGRVGPDHLRCAVFAIPHDKDLTPFLEHVDRGAAVRPAVFEVFDADALGSGLAQEIGGEFLCVGHRVRGAVFEAFFPVPGSGSGEVLDALVLLQGLLDERDVLRRVVGEGKVADYVVEGYGSKVLAFEVADGCPDLSEDFFAGCGWQTRVRLTTTGGGGGEGGIVGALVLAAAGFGCGCAGWGAGGWAGVLEVAGSGVGDFGFEFA